MRVTMKQRRALEGLAFISPWIVGCALLFILPILESIRLSFSELTRLMGFQMRWIGLDNYAKAFVYDVNFLPMFWNTVTDTLINLPLINIFALLLALLLNRKMKLRGFFRVIFFLPALLGTGRVLQQVLGQPTYFDSWIRETIPTAMNAEAIARGVILPEELKAYINPAVGEAIQRLLDRFTLILWRSSVQIVLLLAGLQNISPSLYDSARIDGANQWELFWKVTLPMISPILLLSIIYTMVDSFSANTNPIVMYLVGVTQAQEFEYAAAIAWVYFAFVFLLIAVIYTVLGRYVYSAQERS